MKKIAINEEFSLEGTIYLFAKNEGKIYLKRVREGKSKPSFTPPTLMEVKEYFKSKGYTEQSAQKFFDSYEAGDPKWHDSRGNPVKAWKQKAVMVWFRDENKIIQPTTTGIKFFQT